MAWAYCNYDVTINCNTKILVGQMLHLPHHWLPPWLKIRESLAPNMELGRWMLLIRTYAWWACFLGPAFPWWDGRSWGFLWWKWPTQSGDSQLDLRRCRLPAASGIANRVYAEMKSQVFSSIRNLTDFCVTQVNFYTQLRIFLNSGQIKSNSILFKGLKMVSKSTEKWLNWAQKLV